MIEDGISRFKRGETTLDELLRVVPYEQVVEFRKRVSRNIFRWDTKNPPPEPSDCRYADNSWRV
jgi:hypothetical protein